MKPIPIQLAVEDELSEVVLRKILLCSGRAFAEGTAHRRGGNGYLKTRMEGWNNAARSVPILVLTDLDAGVCPVSLLADWLEGQPHPNLLFRVAVREVEAWLLGDGDQLAAYLGCPLVRIPTEPEKLLDPKRTLIELAGKSRSAAVREQIVPRKGSTARIGPSYNLCLGKFVNTLWRPDIAAARAPSLARALRRLREFEPWWP